MKKYIAGCVAVFLIAGLLSGCAGAAKEPPGTLEKITYRRVRGMIMGGDLLNEAARENVSEEYWMELEEKVLELYPFLTQKETNVIKSFFQKRVSDGGDVDELLLVWKTEKGTEEIWYTCSDYEKLEKLISILK